MVTLKGIEVHIVSSSDDCEFHEYENPNVDSSCDSSKSEKFIEALTDLTYHIKVNIKPSFKLYDADGISVGLTIDGGVVSQRKYYHRDCVEKSKRTGVGFINTAVGFREGSIWRRSTFSFGSLNIGNPMKY